MNTRYLTLSIKYELFKKLYYSILKTMSQFWYDTVTSETLAKEVFSNAVNQLK
jgi:hypothetical protein